MQNLRIVRKSKSLTMKQLGESIGVSESTISQYETGKRQPDNTTLVKLAKFFNCTTDYLLGITDEPNLVHYELPEDYKIDGQSVAIDIVKEALDKGLTEDDLKDIIDMALKLRGKK